MLENIRLIIERKFDIMFKEFIDNHANKATRQANQFAEEKNVEVKSFTAFADNLSKTHLIVEFENAREESRLLRR